MKKTFYFLMMLSLILVACEKSPTEVDKSKFFELSQIPGDYSGGLALITPLPAGGAVKDYLKNGYKTTIIKNKASYTFIFDQESVIQIPNIEVFHDDFYYWWLTKPKLAISAIKSENYVKCLWYTNLDLNPKTHVDSLEHNYFQSGGRSNYMSFNLLLESVNPDTNYFEIWGTRSF